MDVCAEHDRHISPTRSARDFVWIVLGSILFPVAAAAQTFEASAPKPTSAIKLTVSDQNVPIVLMKINGSEPIPMMLHTSNQGIAVTSKTLSEHPDWKMEGESTIRSWGGRSKSRWTSAATVDIQGYRREGMWMIEDTLSGHGTKGKIGLDVFTEPVLWLDFKKGELKTFKQPFELPKGFIDLSAKRDEIGWKLPVKIRLQSGATTRHCLWHSGYSKTLLLDSDWSKKQPEVSNLPVVAEKTVRDSTGKSLTTKTIELPGVTFAKTSFDRFPASIFAGQMGGRSHSVLGMEVIRRFEWIVDRKRQRIAVRPNDDQDAPIPLTDQ